MSAGSQRFARVAATVVLVIPAAAAVSAAFALVDAPAAHAATYQTSQTLDRSGGADQTFTVPPAVTQVFFEMNGGGGGNGGAEGSIAGGAGGPGAEVTGTLNVTPGTTLNVHLGERGHDGSAGVFYTNGAAGGDRPNGTDSGGDGGYSIDSQVAGQGGGGGAASEITTSSALVALAGGGGGGGGGGAIAGYNGGDGGTAGVSARGGTGGTGPGAGSGGGGLSCSGDTPSRVGGTGLDGVHLGGGGGGGGAGYDGTTCGGAGGTGGTTGAGGGGGGGAGASYVDTSNVSGSQVFTAPNATDGSVTFVWAQPTSSLALTATSYGSLARLSATVSPPAGVSAPAPTGVVDFVQSIYGADYSIGSATLNGGVATLMTSNLSMGTYSITARYEGDSVYAPSSSFTTLTYTPAPVTPRVQGGADSDPVQWGGSGTLTAALYAPAGAPSWYPSPTGAVHFVDTTAGPYDVAEVVLRPGDGNSATVPDSWTAHASSYSFKILYDGDSNYNASSTTFSVGVTPATQSTTTLSASRSQVFTGQTVTFTATVRPASGTTVPTGTVRFYDTATVSFGGPPASRELTSSALRTDGTAAITVDATDLYPAQTNTITATYTGDTNLQGSTDNLDLPVHDAAAPTANAGPARSVTSGGSTTVDGSGSVDPQGEPLTYAWSQLDGPAVVIEDKTAAKTKVSVPTTKTQVVVHLRLTVTNAAGLSSTSDTTITVNPK